MTRKSATIECTSVLKGPLLKHLWAFANSEILSKKHAFIIVVIVRSGNWIESLNILELKQRMPQKYSKFVLLHISTKSFIYGKNELWFQKILLMLVVVKKWAVHILLKVGMVEQIMAVFMIKNIRRFSCRSLRDGIR